MYECNYSREPVDFRLLALRLLKKIWVLPVGALLGAIIIGGIYYFSKMVIGNGRTYQAETIYYLDFAEDASGAEYDWVNRYTWSELIHSDFILNHIYEDMSSEMTKEEIINSTEATLESDVRYLYTRCTTHNPEQSIRLARAMEQAIIAFGEHHKEFDNVEISRYPEKAYDNSNIRTVNALILGGCIGLFAVLMYWLISCILDTSVYIPSQLEKRYHIPSLGAASMDEFFINEKLMLEGKNKVALVSCDDIELVREAASFFNAPEKIVIGDFSYNKEEIKAIMDSDACVLLVKAAAHNGKMLERLIEELSRLDIKITAFMLVCEDTSLIKKYYRE